MNNFIIYSIEIAISLALFYTAYWIFLKNETFFKLNRFYLMAAVVISLLTPLLNINIGQNSFIKNIVLPIDRYEERIMGHRHLKNTVADNIGIGKGHAVPFKENAPIVNAGKEESPALNSEETGTANNNINWLTIVLVIYFIGVTLLLIRFVANFVWIFAYVLKNKPQTIFGMKVIRIEKNISPFSFLNFMFISNKDYPEDELIKIISHEKVHIQQKHSIDLILLELLLVAQWFNPFVWFHKRALKITHEYLADQGALNSGIDLPGYQYSLLNQALSENNIEIASSYNFIIKKRIEMMMKKRSTKLATLKLAIALPIFIFLFSAFAFCTESPENINKEINKLAPPADTAIKKVNVPVEYLKLLQGEYLSTNDPEKVRRIIFSELLGTLFGFDENYTYKIIPVGDEKFINPDDKESLVFNSKDKHAINLLLFGKINLNKVYFAKGSGNVQSRSLAFTTANVMIKDGIPAALSYYNKSKDSSNYFITLDDVNYAGYTLLDAGKAKEAAAILKIGTEEFPDFFNLHDSYGEALLAVGDKTKAIEAFKRSLQLNPGNVNGLKRLKELGVNTDGLIKKVKLPIEYLKLLEGVYLSTNEPNCIRKIKFTEENGVLAGSDNGYQYKLIAMGEGKFVNPDDGASFVFDTKDKAAINILFLGTFNLKKVELSKEPAVNIKEYAGIYKASKKDTAAIKQLEIILDNNKLFRFKGTEPEGPNKKIELEFVTENIFFYADKTGRSLEFILDNKKEVTGVIFRRIDGTYNLLKQK